MSSTEAKLIDDFDLINAQNLPMILKINYL